MQLKLLWSTQPEVPQLQAALNLSRRPFVSWLSAKQRGEHGRYTGSRRSNADAEKPYKVVLEKDGEANIEKPVTTMREGEALIKRGTPTPPERDTTHDHEASDA